MSPGLSCVVVVPARDEEQRIAACLRALADQTLPAEAFAVVLVLDGCRDRTAAVAHDAAAALGLPLRPVEGPGRGPGWARRVGMDRAAAMLGPAGLIVTTDADTRPQPDWLARQLAHRDGGARAIAGHIELELDEAARLPRAVLVDRAARAAVRLDRVRRRDPHAAHHHFGGASLAVRADVYRSVGGIEPVAELEDATFERRLVDHGVAVLRPADVRVRTSARVAGRTRRGLAVDLAAALRRADGR